jgi:hypothetical protein
MHRGVRAGGPLREMPSYASLGVCKPIARTTRSSCRYCVTASSAAGIVEGCRGVAGAGVTRMGRDPSLGLGRAVIFAAR